MEKYADRSDCDIIIDQGQKVVMDCDGEKLLAVGNSWNDAQVWQALAFLNQGYALGKSAGGLEVLRDIKKVWRIEE